MAKGSPDKKSKGSKGSPDKKSKGSKGSPDKKSKKSPKEEKPPTPPPPPIREIDLHPNIPVKTNNLHWLSGPGFTFIINRCYTKDQSLLFRDFFNLPVWDHLTLDATIDEYCRPCIHGNCKDWPHPMDAKGPLSNMDKLFAHWNLELPKWDYLHVENHLDEYNRDCCPARNGTNLRTVELAGIPYGPKYVNTYNIQSRAKTILKRLPPLNLGVGYSYLRNLGLKCQYNEAVTKQIQKSYLRLKNVNSVDETMIKRGSSRQKLGLVISAMPGPNAFVIFVVKGTPGSGAKLQFGDQILDVDGLPMNSKLALSRLTENKSVVIHVLYTKCPFKLYYTFSIPLGNTMGFKIVDGNIIFVDENSAAQKADLPLNYQIVEINNECIVGLTNTQLKRELRNRAEVNLNRKVTLTVIPRYIYDALVRRIDMGYIRNRALNESYKGHPVL